MNKTTIAAVLSLAGLGLTAADAFAWGRCGHGCGCVVKHKVVCTQYNAFSPWCCVPVGKRAGLFHHHCCGAPNLTMSCYQGCGSPCGDGMCQGSYCDSPGATPAPQRMPPATAGPEMIPNAPMPAPAQSLLPRPGYPLPPMMAQGGMHPMMMGQPGMPMMMGQPGMPMHPMMMGQPMHPMMAQGMPMYPPYPPYPQGYPVGYYPPPNQALIAPPGTMGMPPAGFPTNMPMPAQ